MAKQKYDLVLATALRFIRVFIGGFLSVAAVISFQDVSSWLELQSALANLLLAGTVAGLSALFVAGDKAIRG